MLFVWKIYLRSHFTHKMKHFLPLLCRVISFFLCSQSDVLTYCTVHVFPVVLITVQTCLRNKANLSSMCRAMRRSHIPPVASKFVQTYAKICKHTHHDLLCYTILFRHLVQVRIGLFKLSEASLVFLLRICYLSLKKKFQITAKPSLPAMMNINYIAWEAHQSMVNVLLWWCWPNG